MKKNNIIIRIAADDKTRWSSAADQLGVSLSRLIRLSVETCIRNPAEFYAKLKEDRPGDV